MRFNNFPINEPNLRVIINLFARSLCSLATTTLAKYWVTTYKNKEWTHHYASVQEGLPMKEREKDKKEKNNYIISFKSEISVLALADTSSKKANNKKTVTYF